MNVLLALVLLAIAIFCTFGFAATFEPVDSSLGWRVGYGAAILVCLFGAVQLLRGGRDEE